MRRLGFRVLSGTLLNTVLMIVSVASSAAQDPASVAIRSLVERLESRGTLRIGGSEVHRSDVLLELYRQSRYGPVWPDESVNAALVAAIRALEKDGLLPGDYHLRAIESLTAAPSAASRGELDVLRSDALVRMVNDLRYGKLDPDAPAAGRRVRLGSGDASELLRMARSRRLEAELDTYRPDHFTYRGLVDALAALREVEARGGWEKVPVGPSLRVGTVDPRVSILRRRLAAEPDLVVPATIPALPDSFDTGLEAAVRIVQHRHGLNEDGIVGPATLTQLNVPVADRIRAIRVNLERARWLTHDLPRTFVAVNIAGARAYFVREGEVIYESRAIVGRTSTRTPIFQASMSYIELNPTWTVPPGIVGEVLSDIRRDPAYLSRVGMEVIDSRGRVVALGRDELLGFTARSFPYVFRQAAGPLNPLGQIKFVFPNPNNVYLHDTPARALFDQEDRMFSHGCIRLQNPLDLAELILGDPQRWSRKQLEEAIAAGRTRTIPLTTPIPVLILYWTASTDLHGELHLYRDVYGRDQAVLRGLDG